MEAFSALRPGSELASLEAAARSRSEADWIVGMNALRGRPPFGCAPRSTARRLAGLGVQTPTLAILARREDEIRAFKPAPYWVVDAQFLTPVSDGPRRYEGRFRRGLEPPG